MTTRSFCPHCLSTLRWFELIPVVSYFVFWGRCSRCASRISLQYPVVEVVSGIAVVLVFSKYGFSAASVRMAFFLLTMLVVALTDWQKFVIPNQVLLVSFIAGVLLQSLPVQGPVSFLQSSFHVVLSSFVSLAVTLLILLGGDLIFKKQTMGFGDVKLAGVIGLYLGWKIFLVVLWGAAFAGAVYGLSMVYILKKPRDTKLPFGSFMAVAAGLALVLEPEIRRIIDGWLLEKL